MKRQIFSKLNEGDKFLRTDSSLIMMRVAATYYRATNMVNAVRLDNGQFFYIANNEWVTHLDNVFVAHKIGPQCTT